jgi:heptosyltransferase-1
LIPLEQCNRILIVKLSSIGDVVMTTPVAKVLRESLPNAYIAWAVEDRAREIVDGNPYLDEVIVWKRLRSGPKVIRAQKFVSGLLELGRELRAREFDLAIDFQGLIKSALVTGISGARFRLGYEDARESSRLFYTDRFEGTGGPRGPLAYVKMLESLGIFSDDLEMHVQVADSDRDYARKLAIQACAGNADWRGIVALCPATTWPQKHWTEEGWARLADALVARYNILPFFLGSKADRPLIDRIRGLMHSPAGDAVGKTTLKEAAAILDLSSVVVAVDTGLLHLSTALDRPTIGIFGPTVWGHMVKKPNFTILAEEMPCAPCMRHPTCEHFDCMSAVSFEDVLAAAEPRLSEIANP